MSVNRDNITWQSKDGSWSIGFYTFYNTGDTNDEDYDFEWDVDYDQSSFWWCRTGFKTPEAAMAAYCYNNANPGSTTIMKYAGNAKEAKEWDLIAFRFLNPEAAAEMDRKENRKRTLAHLKTLNEKIQNAPYILTSRVQVTFKLDDRSFTDLGVTSRELGYLREKGVWLEIAGRKVYNTKTKKVAENIRKIDIYRSSY